MRLKSIYTVMCVLVRGHTSSLELNKESKSVISGLQELASRVWITRMSTIDTLSRSANVREPNWWLQSTFNQLLYFYALLALIVLPRFSLRANAC